MIRTVIAAMAILLTAACGEASTDASDTTPLAAMQTARPSEPPPAGRIDNPFDNVQTDAGMANETMPDVAASPSSMDTGTTAADAAVDASPDATPLPPATSSRTCSDGKRVCREMDSCEDAMFHLQQCGIRRLDGDSDGVPCEKICG